MMQHGKRGRVGHLRRVKDGDRSFCGLVLGGGMFHDPTSPPVVCKRCSAGFEKTQAADHHHLRFRDGRWDVVVPTRRYWYAAGSWVVSYSTICGIEGCDRMVPHVIVRTDSGISGSTHYIKWGQAA